MMIGGGAGVLLLLTTTKLNEIQWRNNGLPCLGECDSLLQISSYFQPAKYRNKQFTILPQGAKFLRTKCTALAEKSKYGSASDARG